MEANPVTKEILKLKRQWEEEAEKGTGIKLFRWVGYKPQLQLVDSFVSFQLSEESFGNHRFLRYVHEFKDPTQHGQTLMTDVEELMAACYKHYSAINPDFPKWETKGQNHLRDGNDAAFFSRNVVEMVEYYELNDIETMVVVLAPANIMCPLQDYENWVVNFVRHLRHSQVKIMVYDTPELNLYESLKKRKLLPIRDIFPDVNISQLMAATIDHQTAKNKEKVPGLDIQKLILEAGDLFGQKEHKAAFDKTELALEVSRKCNLPEQAFSVHVLRSTFYRALKKSKSALEELDLAINAASENQLLCLQGLMFKGGFLLVEKQNRMATETFASAITLAADYGDPGMIIESYRLFALSARKVNAHSHAWEAYVNVLAFAKQLPTEKVQHTTFGLLAKEMLEICSMYGMSPKELENDFRSLLGDSWDQIKQTKKVNSPTSI